MVDNDMYFINYHYTMRIPVYSNRNSKKQYYRKYIIIPIDIYLCKLIIIISKLYT